MTALPKLNGWIRHFLLTIDLNFRNPQAIVYGYLVPVIFLLAFGSVFRADNPPLLAQMGQIMTITILGGACFGLPTALVAEREQGVWRRYRLLPIPTAWLVFSAMLARVLIVASSVLVQIALARAIFGTPFPNHPGAAALAFFFVTAAFLGIGLADRGAGGQCARGTGAGPMYFSPDDHDRRGGSAPGGPAALGATGRRLHAGPLCGGGPATLFQRAERLSRGAASDFGALAVIGVAAGVAGTKLFRWEAGRRTGSARWWVAAALASWAAVGAIAWEYGPVETRCCPKRRRGPISPRRRSRKSVLTVCRPTTTLSRRWRRPILDAAQEQGIRPQAGRPGRRENSTTREQSIRNLVSVAAVADLCADPREAEDRPAGVPANQERVRTRRGAAGARLDHPES